MNGEGTREVMTYVLPRDEITGQPLIKDHLSEHAEFCISPAFLGVLLLFLRDLKGYSDVLGT